LLAKFQIADLTVCAFFVYELFRLLIKIEKLKHACKSGMRIIFHSDMDHFYTAVEGHEQREIRGNPVIGYLIPDVEKGEVLVESLGQGSFQR